MSEVKMSSRRTLQNLGAATGLTPSRRAFLKIGATAGLSTALPMPALAKGQRTQSYVDGQGVWRWIEGAEVALFGVNYNLASASAFRFSKESGQSFDQIIDADFDHFKRMGFDALRLCFWGDWEATSPSGDLIINDHVHVLDKIVARAREEGFHCLLSPIVTYSAFWPDAEGRAPASLSSTFEKSELGTNGAAIAAQCRYLGQLLSRTNPITGTRYAREPAIVAVEPINEPWHHSADEAGSTRYIDALYSAVRGTGFSGPVFHNVTQDMAIAPAIQKSKAEGATFAWYPTGLQNGHAVEGNGLLLVDDYPQFDVASLRTKAKLVYEFDAADTMASYYYPAMVREFRRGGAQLATMFAYDPLPIAASNSEFNDHFLNLVYTPAKAISALIAGLAMHRLPRGKDFGSYPEDMRFDNFRVNDRENLSEYIDDRLFYHSNDTASVCPAPHRLEHLAGCGSSALVDYDGTGAWFLDRLVDGVWQLEIYPDAALVDNPFVFRNPRRDAVKLVWRQRMLKLAIPDLGNHFLVATPDGREIIGAVDGTVELAPGVYRLSREQTGVTFQKRFYVPKPEMFEPVLRHEPPASLTVGKPWHVSLALVTASAPSAVQLHVRDGTRFKTFPLQAGRGFEFSGVIPSCVMKSGFLEYFVTCSAPDGGQATFPHVDGTVPGAWDFPKQGGFRAPIVEDDARIVLFSAERDGRRLIVPYENYVADPPMIVPGDRGQPVVELDGKSVDAALHADVPVQFAWDGSLDMQDREMTSRATVIVEGRSVLDTPGKVMIILIERDGSAWGAETVLSPRQSETRVAWSHFKRIEAAMLPRDYPMSINPYFLRNPREGGQAAVPKLNDLQAVQMTLGKRFLGEARPEVQIEQISIVP